MVNQQTTYRIQQKRDKKRKRRKRLLFLLLPVIIIGIAIGIYLTNLFQTAKGVLDDSYAADGRENGSALRDGETIDPQTGSISILFIGLDTSETRMDQNEGGSRSDALILATLNKDDSSVKMLSIPRDTYVYVPERDMNTKINHAHAYGGVKATIETVEEFLDIPVDYYVSMNFNAFIDVVETLNGINVNVEKEIQEQNSKDEPNAIHLQPGDQLLNGEEALAYARTRKIDNDIERGKRQQEIMKAIADKATSVKSVLKYDDLIEAVGDNMKTNMTFDEIKGLTSYLGNGKLNIETNILEGEDSYIDGVYYFQANEQSVANIQTELKNHLDLSNPAAQTTN